LLPYDDPPPVESQLACSSLIIRERLCIAVAAAACHGISRLSMQNVDLDPQDLVRQLFELDLDTIQALCVSWDSRTTEAGSTCWVRTQNGEARYQVLMQATALGCLDDALEALRRVQPDRQLVCALNHEPNFCTGRVAYSSTRGMMGCARKESGKGHGTQGVTLISDNNFQGASLIDPVVIAVSISEAISRTLPELAPACIDHGELNVEVQQVHPVDRNHSRRPWSSEEEDSLHAGVVLHGEGNWQAMRNNPRLNFNARRTAGDLKDKWRNLKNKKKLGVDARYRMRDLGGGIRKQSSAGDPFWHAAAAAAASDAGQALAPKLQDALAVTFDAPIDTFKGFGAADFLPDVEGLLLEAHDVYDGEHDISGEHDDQIW
jgi:hypothetical protein